MYTGSFGPASNRADYRETIQLREADDVEVPAIEEIELVIGRNSGCGIVRKLFSADQIAYDDELGEFTFTLSAEEMRRFPAGTLDMGIVLTLNGIREQLFAGDFVVVDGVVA